MSKNTTSAPYRSQFFEGPFMKDTNGHFNSNVANRLAELGIHPLRETVQGKRVVLELGLTESDLADSRSRIEGLGLQLLELESESVESEAA